MSHRDPLVLARQMAESYLARPDVVAKGTGAAPSLGMLVMTFLPAAQGLCPVLDALDDRIAGIGEEMDGLTVKMQTVLDQDQQRRGERARLQERLRNPKRQVRFADVDEARVAELREALRTAGLAQVGAVNGHGKEAPDG